jgi:hypothetical protein
VEAPIPERKVHATGPVTQETEVIVIDPNGLGPNQPTVGMGFRMMERHAGIPNNTLAQWVLQIGDEKHLKVPSGKTFRVLQIPAEDGNTYSVIEARDWMFLAVDVLNRPGKVRSAVCDRLSEFVLWFAVKGFYAEAYAVLKGAYTPADSRATSAWLQARLAGVPVRKSYTDMLQGHGCDGPDYASWTNYIYLGLFGMDAKQMRDIWATVNGRSEIARNHIQESEGLDAVRTCEDLAVRVYAGDLRDAHDQAIVNTRKRVAYIRNSTQRDLLNGPSPQPNNRR